MSKTYKNIITGNVIPKEVRVLSYAIMQKLKYIVDIYTLAFVLGTSGYGLLVDINQSRAKGTNRDARMAKRIYITFIAVILSIYIIIRII